MCCKGFCCDVNFWHHDLHQKACLHNPKHRLVQYWHTTSLLAPRQAAELPASLGTPFCILPRTASKIDWAKFSLLHVVSHASSELLGLLGCLMLITSDISKVPIAKVSGPMPAASGEAHLTLDHENPGQRPQLFQGLCMSQRPTRASPLHPCLRKNLLLAVLHHSRFSSY